MNACHFIGNLTRDPDLTTVAGGKKKVRFTIAVDRRLGKDKKETAFLDCEAWEQKAELIARHFVKGDPIIVHAQVRMDRWETDEGEKRSRLYFGVQDFDWVPSRREKSEGGVDFQKAARKSAPTTSFDEEPAPVEDDGIPF